MPYTDWAVDTDVSAFMHKDALIEEGITDVSGDDATLASVMFSKIITRVKPHLHHTA